MENGRNFPRYSSFAGAGAASSSNGAGARRRQRGGGGGRPRGQFQNNGGVPRPSTDVGAPRSSPPRNPQKFKSFSDKRPRTRNGTAADAADTEIDPAIRSAFGYELESGDFGDRRGRGVRRNDNFNHLLNFRYDETKRGRGRHDSGRQGGRGRKTSTSSCHVAFTKDHFLLANCQFDVNVSADVESHRVNPDLLVDWNVVEQVHIRSAGDLNVCPICLAPPVAPQVTKCGHVFCLACALHHAAGSDKKWAPCPICFEMVYVEDLRSAAPRSTRGVVVGETVELTLMTSSIEDPIPRPVVLSDFITDPFRQIRVVQVTDILSDVVEPEVAALEASRADADVMEAAFIDQALAMVAARKEKLLKEDWDTGNHNFIQAGNEDEVEESVVEAVPLSVDGEGGDVDWFDEEPFDKEESVEDFCLEEGLTLGLEETNKEKAKVIKGKEVVEARNEGEGESEGSCEQASTSESVDIAERSAEKVPSKPTVGEYYFYQSSDGQKIFLHSLNSKCLTFEHGSLASAPPVVSGRVLQIDEGTVTSGLRRRCRYLASLPVNCVFRVVELDLKAPFVSREALDHFADESSRRRLLRQQKERHERRLHRKQQKKDKRANVVIVPSEQHVPRRPAEVGDCEDDVVFPEYKVDAHVWTTKTTTPAKETDDDDHVTSFAQMLRSGKAQTEASHRSSKMTTTGKAWPDLGAGKSLPPGKEVDPEDESAAHPPAFKESFSDALAKALDDLEVKEEEKLTDSSVSSTKKKKKKPKLLFATSMQPRM